MFPIKLKKYKLPPPTTEEIKQQRKYFEKQLAQADKYVKSGSVNLTHGGFIGNWRASMWYSKAKENYELVKEDIKTCYPEQMQDLAERASKSIESLMPNFYKAERYRLFS